MHTLSSTIFVDEPLGFPASFLGGILVILVIYGVRSRFLKWAIGGLVNTVEVEDSFDKKSRQSIGTKKALQFLLALVV